MVFLRTIKISEGQSIHRTGWILSLSSPLKNHHTIWSGRLGFLPLLGVTFWLSALKGSTIKWTCLFQTDILQHRSRFFSNSGTLQSKTLYNVKAVRTCSRECHQQFISNKITINQWSALFQIAFGSIVRCRLIDWSKTKRA